MTAPSGAHGVSGNGPTAILVPGGFIGVGMWSDVVGLLEREGIAAVAVPLTSGGRSRRGREPGERGDRHRCARGARVRGPAARSGQPG